VKKFIEYGLVILCLIPLFSINIKTSHDWGDDFAQYLHQAKNINEGVSQNQTGYIFNEKCFVGPQAYPVGFPLLLSPIVKQFGLNFYYLNLSQTLFLALSCLIGFIIIRQYTSFFAAFFTALIIGYNPTLLYFKTEIISDLPFTFFSMLCVFLMTKKHNYFLSVLLGLLIGFSIHIRSVGLILILVFLLNRLFLENNIREFSIKNHFKTFLTLLSATFVYLGIKLLWPTNTNYPGVLESDNYWQNINEHFSYNLHHLSMFFRGFAHANYWSIGIVASCSLIVFAILGLFHFYSENKKSIYTYYVLIYLLAVISYKFSHAGMRFLYPILFFIFLFAIIGFKKSFEPFMRQQKWLALFFGLLILYSYQEELDRINQFKSNIADGPQLKESEALFNYINTKIQAGSIVAFDKPRALTLYSHVHSFAFSPDIKVEEIKNDILKFKAQYYLTNESQSSEVIKNHPLKDSLNYQLVFQNEIFKLFKIK